MRLFVDRLSNVDFSYLCPLRGLVGETWLASIQLTGALDQQGMICDFGHVKKYLRDWLEDTLDHRLLIPTQCPQVSLESAQQQTGVRMQTAQGLIWCQAPSQAMTAIDSPEITPDTVAHWCLQHLEGQFGDSVGQIELQLAPETIQGPYYHYSHGLKKHLGDCQRIAHGHRSTIKIWRNGELCQNTMANWAKKWADIYIATQEDCYFKAENELGFRYQAQQGEFTLHLPRHQCYLIDTDTTVEYLALHIAQKLQEEHPEDHFVVKAYEGIGKGALAETSRKMDNL